MAAVMENVVEMAKEGAKLESSESEMSGVLFEGVCAVVAVLLVIWLRGWSKQQKKFKRKHAQFDVDVDADTEHRRLTGTAPNGEENKPACFDWKKGKCNNKDCAHRHCPPCKNYAAGKCNCGKQCDFLHQGVEQRKRSDTPVEKRKEEAATDAKKEAAAEVQEERHVLFVQKHMKKYKHMSAEMWQHLRANDMQKAVDVLEKANAAGYKDHELHNGALVICANYGDVAGARDVLATMQEAGTARMFAYNTMMKAYAFHKDMAGAKAVMDEMQEAGTRPNHISYNILTNLAASCHDLVAVWDCVKMRLACGIAVDAHVVSIILKAVRNDGKQEDLLNVFKLMEKCGIEHVGSDRVLLSVFLEACLKHDCHKWMGQVLRKSPPKLSRLPHHTLELLVKAWDKLDDIEECLSVWNEMVNVQGIRPTYQAVAHMIEALTRNGLAEVAVDFYDKWTAEGSGGGGKGRYSLWQQMERLRAEVDASE